MYRLIIILVLALFSACDDDSNENNSNNNNNNNVIKEICNNGIDDNGDSLVDCDDPHCLAYPPCYLPECGDGIVGNGEDCDGDTLNGVTCQSLGYYGGELACTGNCLYDITDCQNHGKCGDGKVDTYAGESCDLSDINNKECTDFGGYGGILRCNADCTLDFSLCMMCGDGFVQTEEGEECDGTNIPDSDCTDYGYTSGNASCSEFCKLDFSTCHGECGDGIFEDQYGEECENTDFGAKTCRDYGKWVGDLVCNECTVNTSDCSNTVYPGGNYDRGFREDASGNIYFASNDSTYNFNVYKYLSDGTLFQTFVFNYVSYNSYFRSIDFGFDVSPSNRIVVAGVTDSKLGENITTAFGDNDGFIAVFEPDGSTAWVRQYGTNSEDLCGSSIFDNSGNIISTCVGRSGFAGVSTTDAVSTFILKHDSNGNLLTVNTLPSVNSSSNKLFKDNSGNIYLVHNTSDIFTVSKLDSNIEPIWSVSFANPLVFINNLTFDNTGNIYLTGYVEGRFPGQTTLNTGSSHHDAMLVKISSAGVILWQRQWGNTNYWVSSADAIIDQGNIMVFGDGRLQPYLVGTYSDMHYAIFSPSGEMLESYQFDYQFEAEALKLLKHSDSSIYILLRPSNYFDGKNSSSGLGIYKYR
ncbi:SBBP repeat-containing protein [Myxococcota bacterium]|nr:SBBP repeat-containing protein [Myxococcota bacterium]MBU1382763.1 SBBP repeat-containing protein [Myxococcota bacterium]MBU1495345.1 SBBP repeat-containing protein [Myxococcota bacterium]